jgi:FkbM family methyltransferase
MNMKVKLDEDLTILTPAKTDSEIKFLYKEIFIDSCYLKHGVKVENGNTVIDVGANLGLFSLSLARSLDNLTIYAFEPVPPIYECLVKNTSQYRNVHPINMGIAEMEKEYSITFMPYTPGNSTIYPEEKRKEMDNLFDKKLKICDVWKMSKLKALKLICFYPLKKQMVQKRLDQFFLASQKFNCKLTSLDHFIQSKSLETIDLLKVDVEGAEQDVFSGLSDDNFAKVRQIVVEVSPARKQWVTELISKLRKIGFVHIQCESMVPNSDPFQDSYPCNLYAIR